MKHNPYKKEKREHRDLLKKLKAHFSEDEEDIKDQMMEEDEGAMEMDERMPRGEYEEYDDEYGGDEMEEEVEYEDEEEMDDEEMPKKDRKDLAVMIMAKKLGKRKMK